jgi:hypothetical protein
VAAKVVLPSQDFFFLSVLTGRGGVGSGFWLFNVQFGLLQLAVFLVCLYDVTLRFLIMNGGEIGCAQIRSTIERFVAR